MAGIAAHPPRQASPRVRAAGWLAAALLVAFAVRRALLEPLAAAVPTEANTDLTRGQDFRDALYYPIKELLSGGNPYDPAAMFAGWPVRQEFDLYAPLHLVLHLPYALLPYRVGLIVFSCVSIGYLLAIGLVSARVLRLPGGWLAAWTVAGLVVLAQFGKSAVYFGQVGTLVGLGGVLALLFLGRSTGWCALGLALTWIKPQFGIPLTLFLLARGGWRPAVLGTGGAAALSLPVAVLLVVREGGLGGFLAVIRANLAYATSTGYAAVDSPTGARVDVAAVFFRLVGWLPPGAEIVVAAGVVGVTCWLLAGRPHLPLDVRDLFLASLGTLLCIVHQQSESLVTVPALVAVAAVWLRGRRPGGPVVAATVLVCVPVVHVSFVESLLIDTVGPRVDSLVEGVSLLLAFVLVSATSWRHRNAPITDVVD